MRGDFVIQVKPDPNVNADHLQGRIEHMDSGHSVRFRTVQELLAFILQHVQSPDPNRPDPNPQSLTKR